ncbi:MAG TPA: replicative DNA helicase, partial [Mycobacteriales bacterium]|nr:replicative DNA helicase [Mycobacteriales bacterium]
MVRQSEFDRQPPQDLQAEQSVLGGMLLSKDAIADVVEVLRSADFYRPAHQVLYDTILDLYGRGEPADPVTVSAELTRSGQLLRVGGTPYLHTLISSVPTAANAGFYAEIVAERATLRRLVEAGTRIVQLGYGAASGQGGDVDEVVDRAQAEIYDVTERRTSEDYVRLEQLLQGTMDEIDAISSRGGTSIGVPTGFSELDQITNGLHPGQMVIIAARPAIGKALALDTPLPTPDGWTTMGEVAVGDRLLGADGRPTTVVAATDVMHDRACYEVEFSDGTVVVADAEHQWKTTTRASRRAMTELLGPRFYWPHDSIRRVEAVAARAMIEMDRLVTRKDIVGEVGQEFGAVVHTVAQRLGAAGAVMTRSAGPPRTYERHTLAYSRRRLASALADRVVRPVNVWHAAEHADVVTTEEMAATLRCSSADRRPNHAIAVAGALQLPDRQLPLPPYVLGAWLGDGHSAGASDKHIPPVYLRASESQRRALLAGLLDTDGTVSVAGTVQFAVTNRRLAEGTLELVLSLGYRASMTTKPVNGRRPGTSTCYTVTFTPADPVFRLTRKAQRQVPATRTAGRRYVVDVRPVPSVPVRCVQVDNDDHLYLVSRSMVPTHNSTLALDFSRACSIKHGMSAVIFSLEMSKSEITMRLLSAEAKVPLHHMRSGHMSDDDWARLARRMGEVADAPLYIDDSPNLTMMEIRAKARRLRQRHDLRLVVIDYMQLMTSGKRVESRQVEVSEFSRSLKLLAKELDVPVVAISQLNRGPEQRTDKKPMLSDLRESGCMTEDTTVLRADTGAPVTFRELLDNGHEGVLVWSMDERRRLVPAPITNVFRSGVKPAYRLQLASGRTVKATGDHRFLAFNGWTSLGSIAVGDRIAIPRRTPEPVSVGLGWSDSRLGLLAHLLGDGCVLRSQPVHYTSDDEANLEFVETAAAAEFGISPRRVQQGRWWHTYLPAPYHCTYGRGNPLHAWFRELGIEDRRSYEKRIPDVLHSASNSEIAVFLRHLWATDGSVTTPKPGTSTAAKVYYATTSRPLADGVVLLLSRFGMIARVKTVTKADYRPSYHVTIADGPSLRMFCREIGVHGRRGETARRLLVAIDDRATNTNVDTLPREAWDLVKAERYRAGITERQFQAAMGTNYCGSSLYRTGASRERMLRCALDSTELRAVAEDDVFWDRVIGIEALGAQPVYDATVKGTHNFIADGIIAHNSLEQDADMVILLHRE